MLKDKVQSIVVNMKKNKRVIWMTTVSSLLILGALLTYDYEGARQGGVFAYNHNKHIVLACKVEVEEPITDVNIEKKAGRIKIVKMSSSSSTTDEIYKKNGVKIAYLTFDDGPSTSVTPEILRVLKSERVCATFFVMGCLAEKHPETIKEMFDSGHSIGNHTYSHDYKEVYDPDNFAWEIEHTNKILSDILGEDYHCKLFRFPGGSFERYKNTFKEYLKEKDMSYIDWNIDSEDSKGQNIPPEKILENIINQIEDKEHLVILMHDAGAKRTTAEGLPAIIEELRNRGYEFGIIR